MPLNHLYDLISIYQISNGLAKEDVQQGKYIPVKEVR
nr:MAG TPA: hypothetical protein [Caudoviricetes sp.]